jgi:hypothetical protein
LGKRFSRGAQVIETVIVNSSSGTGIAISIDRGSRSEYFMNTPKHWFYASERVLDGVNGYYEWQLKTHGLGDLLIYRMSWAKKSQPERVASFSKGTWEYARLLVEDKQMVDEEDRNLCPKGCFVTGYADLSKETQRAHMDYNH